MPDSEITSTILRQIRDRLDVTNERLDVLTTTVNERFSINETVLRDVVEQLILLRQYMKQKQDPVIADLRRRVGRLEKKVG